MLRKSCLTCQRLMNRKSIKRKRGGVGKKGVYGKTPKIKPFVEADLMDNIARYYKSYNYENLIKSIDKISKDVLSDKDSTVLDILLKIQPHPNDHEKHNELIKKIIEVTPVELFTNKTAIAARKAIANQTIDNSIKQKLLDKTNNIDFAGKCGYPGSEYVIYGTL